MNIGLPVRESELCMTRAQVRFPRSKRRRIQKKWAKQDRNFEEKPAVLVVDFGYVLGGMGLGGPWGGKQIIVHPALMGLLNSAADGGEK